MAKIEVTDITTLGVDDELTGVWWQASPDIDFANVTEESKYDPTVKLIWRTPLRSVANDDSTMYDGSSVMYVRVKLRFGTVETGWYDKKMCRFGDYGVTVSKHFIYNLPAILG